MALRPDKRQRLFRKDLPAFAGETLFDRIGRAVCEAECLPRRELYESWETARRVRRRFRSGPVVEVAAGHGLLAWILLILDDTSPEAYCIDCRKPPSADRLAPVLTRYWPRLAGRVRYVEAAAAAVAVPSGALLACVHGCGTVTDEVVSQAIAGRLRLAAVPCCHSRERCDTGGLEGWMASDLAIDATRVARLRQAGFAVWSQLLPRAITAKNRLLLAAPTG